VTALLAHAEGADTLVVLLGTYAGPRVSGMTAPRGADVDLGRRRLVMRDGKGGKRCTVPLSSTLVAALGEAGHVTMTEAHVVPYKDRLAVWYRLRALAKRASVVALGVHSLHHYAGTHLTRENNGNLRPAQKMRGHESIVPTEVDIAPSDESLAAQLTAWETTRRSRTALLSLEGGSAVLVRDTAVQRSNGVSGPRARQADARLHPANRPPRAPPAGPGPRLRRPAC